MMSAREYFLTRLPEVNTYFHDASYGTMSVKFDTTPDWIPLTFDFDFYFWTQDDIDLAANQLAQAEHDLDIVKQSYGATPTDLKIAEDDVEHKKDMLNHAKDAQLYLQRPAFLFGEALIAAKNIMPDFDDYTDYVFVTAGIPGAIRAQYTGSAHPRRLLRAGVSLRRPIGDSWPGELSGSVTVSAAPVKAPSASAGSSGAPVVPGVACTPWCQRRTEHVPPNHLSRTSYS